jgi:hypothetical protein
MYIMKLQEKLYNLKSVRADIGEETFKFSAAAIIAKDYSELLRMRGVKRDRMHVFDRTNLMLHSIGCSEVSYGFLRRYV